MSLTLELSMLTLAHVATKHPYLFCGSMRGRKTGSYLERRRDFTPLCYTADGMAGRDARNAERRLGHKLAEEWSRQPSQMIF